MIYGFNFTHLSNLNATPEAKPGMEGVVSTYHLPRNRDRAVAIMKQAQANGLQAIRIPLWIGPAEDFIEKGLNDGYLLNLQTDSFLIPQEWTNLQNFLDDVASLNFTFVEIGPGYAEGRLNPFSWTTIEGNWNRPAMLLANLRTIMLARKWQKFSIDLAGELIRPDFPVVLQYAATVWDWYCYDRRQAGQSVTDGSISCIADPGLIAGIPQVFKGYWPWKVGIHPYNPEPGVAWNSSFDAINGTIAGLRLAGVPDSVEKHIDETYDFRDVTNCAGIQRGLDANPSMPFTVVQQWAVMRGQPNTSPAISPWPASSLGI